MCLCTLLTWPTVAGVTSPDGSTVARIGAHIVRPTRAQDLTAWLHVALLGVTQDGIGTAAHTHVLKHKQHMIGLHLAVNMTGHPHGITGTTNLGQVPATQLKIKHTRRFYLLVPDVPMSCRDLITWESKQWLSAADMCHSVDGLLSNYEIRDYDLKKRREYTLHNADKKQSWHWWIFCYKLISTTHSRLKYNEAAPSASWDQKMGTLAEHVHFK